MIETTSSKRIIPPERTHYLREIVNTVRQYHRHSKQQAELASQLYQLHGPSCLLSQGIMLYLKN